MPRYDVTNDELIAALRELEQGGPRVNLDDFCLHLGVSRSVILYRFGSWNSLRRLAGLPLLGCGKRDDAPGWTRDRLRDELQKLVAELGPRITFPQFLEKTGVRRNAFVRLCGSWLAFRRELGLPLNSPRKRFSDDELLADLDRLQKHFGRLPNDRELATYGKFGYSTYGLRIGNKKQRTEALRKYRICQELARRGLRSADEPSPHAATPPKPLPDPANDPLPGLPAWLTGWF